MSQLSFKYPSFIKPVITGTFKRPPRKRATVAEEDAILKKAAGILRRRLLARRKGRYAEPFSSPDMVKDAITKMLCLQVAEAENERFFCIALDNRHRYLHHEQLFNGTIDGASVHPREVVKWAMRYNAAALIFAHNHPSGIAEPSNADIAITAKLKDALQLVDVRVLDHFVIGEGEPVSLSERGLI